MISATSIPIIIVIAIYMLNGVFGNTMVIIYYGFKVQPNPSFMLITVMAISDLTVCCVSMPLEILDFSSERESLNDVACKILRFTNYLAVLCSVTFLQLIAIDRYRNLCKPFGNQISTHLCKILIGVAFGCSLALASPNLVLWGIFEVNQTSLRQQAEYGMNVTDGIITHDCMLNRAYDVFVTVYHGVFFLMFVLFVLNLAYLYYHVVKEIILMEKYRKGFRKDIYHITKFENTQSGSKMPQMLKYKSQLSVMKTNRVEDEPTKNEQNKTERPIEISEEEHIQISKLARMAVSITIAFVISFLPYLCLMIWIKISDDFMKLSGFSLVVYDIFLRSWLLNSVVNPVIYGFFNSHFKQFVFSHFCNVFAKAKKAIITKCSGN